MARTKQAGTAALLRLGLEARGFTEVQVELGNGALTVLAIDGHGEPVIAEVKRNQAHKWLESMPDYSIRAEPIMDEATWEETYGSITQEDVEATLAAEREEQMEEKEEFCAEMADAQEAEVEPAAEIQAAPDVTKGRDEMSEENGNGRVKELEELLLSVKADTVIAKNGDESSRVRAVFIKYKDENGEETQREIYPGTGNVYPSKEGHLLLTCYCSLRKERRTFRLDRITAIHVLDKYMNMKKLDDGAVRLFAISYKVRKALPWTTKSPDNALASGNWAPAPVSMTLKYTD